MILEILQHGLEGADLVELGAERNRELDLAARVTVVAVTTAGPRHYAKDEHYRKRG